MPFAEEGTTGMHTLTVWTMFTFGDRVRFDSPTQQRSGSGTVFAITVDRYGQVDYMIDIGQGAYSDLQPGILENEMTLLGTAGEGSA
jgi:hypothetical protein